ncbi:hypothetical protein [Butyrivibrio sp. VCD2006]|uniref:hypothetical protein n=1 Tax=Butyrivibrio sp. VCD2006 TaxID=1280664 RepID=UPI00047BF9B4|nr:hypothetical protein [Butyrivibrio sp. VCD2006]
MALCNVTFGYFLDFSGGIKLVAVKCVKELVSLLDGVIVGSEMKKRGCFTADRKNFGSEIRKRGCFTAGRKNLGSEMKKRGCFTA